MARASKVEDFIANCMADGVWDTPTRDRFMDLAENNASAMSLFNFLREYGFEGQYYNVNNWKKSRDIGTFARELNTRSRQARGLKSSDALNQLAGWMLQVIAQLYEELGRRDDLDKVSTKDLLFLISTYGGKAQAAIAEADKVRNLHDSQDLIIGTLEEVRMSWRQTHEAENPELIRIIDGVLEMVRAKLDV